MGIFAELLSTEFFRYTAATVSVSNLLILIVSFLLRLNMIEMFLGGKKWFAR